MLLRRALQMYVMSGDARGPTFMRHNGNRDLNGAVLTIVITCPEGVDLDAALWARAELERDFGATHDAAGAGASRQPARPRRAEGERRLCRAGDARSPVPALDAARYAVGY
jgi:hypothetical protein